MLSRDSFDKLTQDPRFPELVKLIKDNPSKGAKLILELREELKSTYMFIAAIVEEQPKKEIRVSDKCLRIINRKDEIIKLRDEREMATIVKIRRA